MDTRQIYEVTTRRFLAPIQKLLDDPSVSEVMVNGPKSIYFERQGKLQRSDCQFADELSLLAAARNIAEFVNRRVDADHHSLDGRLPDGSSLSKVKLPAEFSCGTRKHVG
jgi:pilus assembly protein CpaF